MRFFFIGPRILGIRPGISFSPNDFRKLSRPASSAKSEMTGGFVYVLADESGRHKIGSSRDPIDRIAKLQTGFRGTTELRLLHPERRRRGSWCQRLSRFGAVMEAAFRLGEPIQQVPLEIVPQVIYLASTNSAPQKQKFTESFAFFFDKLPGRRMLGGLFPHLHWIGPRRRAVQRWMRALFALEAGGVECRT
jgi:hypothetical protein